MINRLLLLSILTLSFFSFFSHHAIAAEGDVAWTQASNPTPYFDTANKVVSDASGIYIVGYEGNGKPTRMRIEKRRHVDGSMIAPFPVIFSPGSNISIINDIAIDSTGIYVVGYNDACCFGSDYEWRVEKRSLTDGSLVWGVNQNFSVGNFAYDIPRALSVHLSRVYIAGQVTISGSPAWRVEARDKITGIVQYEETKPTYVGSATGIYADNSGVYITGHILDSGNKKQWRTVKWPWNLYSIFYDWGEDTSFVTLNNEPTGIVADSSGAYVAGWAPFWDIRKLNPFSGALFWHQTESSITYGKLYDISMDSNGNIYTAGFNQTGPPESRWRIEKRNSSGVLQSPWPKEPNPSTGNDIAYGITLDNDSVYTVGYSLVSGSDFQWYIEKREIVSSCNGPFSFSWTNPIITAGVTKVRTAHISELRNNINTLAQDAGLSNFSWTDPIITAGTTKIRTVHIQELRNAIVVVYNQCGQNPGPLFTDPSLTTSIKIRKIHIDELRNAINNAL